MSSHSKADDLSQAESQSIKQVNGQQKSTKHHQEFSKHGDKAQVLGEERVVVTEEDNKRILRKTDFNVLPLLTWVYFLQILDKSVIGYSAVFGLRENAGLVGNQYSTIGSIGYYAQLGAQPFGAWLLVKVPIRTLMPIIVFCWGVSLCGMAASNDFKSLCASRFLLGLFEALCLPMFGMITSAWYRRAEQPLRVAVWYGTNGLATILGSALCYGLGHINSTVLYSYQIIFLVFGLITVITAPILYWRLDNSIVEARWLTEEDRLKGVERLRANNSGVGSTKFKLKQAIELFTQPLSWLFFAMSFAVNVGASVSNVFGPIIIQQLIGFTKYEAMLLNMPFGFLQLSVIVISSYLAYRFSTKSVIFGAMMAPVVIGVSLLYALPREASKKGGLLVGYYLIAFVFSANPLLVSWLAASYAGSTKKASAFVMYQAFSSVGNIVGPYLFKSTDAPGYKPGLRAVLGIFIALMAIVAIQAFNILWLNKRKADQRERNGKPRNIKDLSMQKKFATEDEDATEEKQYGLGEQAFLDLTDKENDEFVYVL
ncbi:hypothetical protein OIV83_003726 [Microbotryomycetes sp. JL201]|nr:hypothetical protein OIV83_003726 [Microbotryomycetes sp. JL201]